MALAQEDIEQIQQLIQQSLLAVPLNANVRYELDLRERTIRVEEELKHQRELMTAGFKQMDRRFEQVNLEMEKRFEQVEKRIERMDKRLEQVNLEMNQRFEQAQLEMNKRFEQVDKRFEQVDKRIEQVDKRIEQQHQEIMGLHHEIKLLMRWSFGTLLAIGGLIVAVLRLAP